MQLRRRLASIPELGWLVAGYCGVVAIVLAYFWSQHALWDLYNANVVFPSRHYGAANVVPYASGIIWYYWSVWIGSGTGNTWLVGLATVLMGPFLFVAALPAVVGILGILHRNKPAKPEILLYWLCGVALWLSEIHRKDIFHLVFGSPLLMILCIYYIGGVSSQSRTMDSADSFSKCLLPCGLQSFLGLVCASHGNASRLSSCTKK